MTDRVVKRLLAVIAVVAVVWLLRVAEPVVLPLAFALFLIALFWPVYAWMEERSSAGWAVVGSLLALLLTAGVFAGALWIAAKPVVEQAPRYADEPGEIVERVREWAREHGLSMGAGQAGAGEQSGGGAAEGGGGAGGGSLSVRSLAGRAFSIGGALVMVVAFFVLGLLEVHDFRRKLTRATGGRPDDEWREPVFEIISGVQRYIVVRTGVGLLQGVACGVYAWAIGLDLAVVWGVLSFLLNYIPTLGSVVAVAPPTVFALGEHGGQMALLTAGGMGGLQLLLGNYVDPLVQGKYLELSPLVVLLSVVFWGWVWGVAGSFIGIPLTVALVIGLDRFESTRWLSTLLADVERRGHGAEAPPSAPAAAEEPAS